VQLGAGRVARGDRNHEQIRIGAPESDVVNSPIRIRHAEPILVNRVGPVGWLAVVG
jgi:hypothetical protein